MCPSSGTKRFDSEKAGDREVQRTMLELLNQLDGFQPNHDIKVDRGFYPIPSGCSLRPVKNRGFLMRVIYQESH